MILYSKSTNYFYDDGININIPEDAIEISKEQHLELLQLQNSGKIISTDRSGNPIAIDPDELLTTEQKLIKEKQLLKNKALDLMYVNDFRWNNSVRWNTIYDQNTKNKVSTYYLSLLSVVNGESDIIPEWETEIPEWETEN